MDQILKAEIPDAAYLIQGDDDFLKQEAVHAIISHFSDAATRAFTVDVLHGEDADPATLATAIDSVPMLATRRLVVLRDFPALRKESRAVLDARLRTPPPDVTILLVAPAGWRPDTSLAAHVTTVDIATPQDREAVTWIVERARMYGTTIEPDAATLLLRATAGDLGQADGELKKLRDYAASGQITTTAVGAVVGVTAGATSDDLVDLVCARNGPGAAAIVGSVLAQPKTNAVQLVLALTAHLLLLGQAVASRARGVGPRQLASELYAVMNAARSVAIGRRWSDAVAAVTRHADAWDLPAIDRGLEMLRDVDDELKEASLSSEAHIMETLVLRLCAASPRSRAA